MKIRSRYLCYLNKNKDTMLVYKIVLEGGCSSKSLRKISQVSEAVTLYINSDVSSISATP